MTAVRISQTAQVHPAVYCTADIAVNDATLTANNSEGICIEGLNSLYIFDSDLTSSLDDNEQNDCTWSVIVYQSMSGDSEVGCGTYQMAGGSLTSDNRRPVLYHQYREQLPAVRC